MDANAAKMMIDGLDIPEFKIELADTKDFLLDFFGLDKDLDEETKKTKHRVLTVIENLQVAFTDVNAIDELDQKELEAIRPDFDFYIKYTDLEFEDDEFFEDDSDFEDEDFLDEDDELEMMDEASQKENKLIELNKRMKSHLNL